MRTIFEHKTLNKDIRAALTTGVIPEQYRIQMEQQLLVYGGDRCLFMASEWDDNDELIEEVHCWYEPDLELRARIVQGWAQLETDIKNYVPPEYIPAAVATPTKDLPALSIQVNGSISLISNLDLFGTQLNAFVGQINKEPNDDQGFADAEAAIKTLQKAEDALEASESSALAQTASIDDMRKTVQLYKDIARATRLMLKKMVEERKKSIKIEVIQEGNDAYAKHLEAIDKRLGKPYVPKVPADFVGAISGAKSIKGLRERMKNELLRVQLASTEIADKAEVNLNTLRESTKDHAFLFADTAVLVLKENEDLVTLIKVRIFEHEQAVADKQKAEREKMRIEEEAKAKAKIEAEAQASRLTPQQVEQAEKAKRIQDNLQEARGRRVKNETEQTEIANKSDGEAGRGASMDCGASEDAKPAVWQEITDEQVITSLADEFDITFDEACLLIVRVAKNMRIVA